MATMSWGLVLPPCPAPGLDLDPFLLVGYPVGQAPAVDSLYLCAAGARCGNAGQAGWVTAAYPDGSFEAAEQLEAGGDLELRHRESSEADCGFVYNPFTGRQPGEIDDSFYVDETIPDGTRLRPGEHFTKRWIMRNSGTTTWTRPAGYRWSYDHGESFSASIAIELAEGPGVAPWRDQVWEVPMVAPTLPGVYRGYWHMERLGIHPFGESPWVEIVVVDPATGASTGSKAVPDSSCHAGSRGGSGSFALWLMLTALAVWRWRRRPLARPKMPCRPAPP
jgi:hypothetical protein